MRAKERHRERKTETEKETERVHNIEGQSKRAHA